MFVELGMLYVGKGAGAHPGVFAKVTHLLPNDIVAYHGCDIRGTPITGIQGIVRKPIRHFLELFEKFED